jgi:hypothetical protein
MSDAQAVLPTIDFHTSHTHQSSTACSGYANCSVRWARIRIAWSPGPPWSSRSGARPAARHDGIHARTATKPEDPGNTWPLHLEDQRPLVFPPHSIGPNIRIDPVLERGLTPSPTRCSATRHLVTSRRPGYGPATTRACSRFSHRTSARATSQTLPITTPKGGTSMVTIQVPGGA